MNKGIMKGRSLYPEELEVRVDAISDKSFTVVVYITSRAAMNLLDDLYGPDSWSRRLSFVKTTDGFVATCRLTLRRADGCIVTREDVGEDGKSAKAAASDAIKRAATNFIPELRALYTLPTLRIKAADLGVKETGKDKVKEAIRFKNFAVSSIVYGTSASGSYIKALQIIDEDTGEVVKEYRSNRKSLSAIGSPELLELKAAIADAGLTEEQVLKDYKEAYGINSLDDLVKTNTVLEAVYSRIERSKKKKPAARGASVNEQLKGKKEA